MPDDKIVLREIIAEYPGLSAEEIVAELLLPREAGTAYRELSTKEVYDAIPAGTKARLGTALDAYAAAGPETAKAEAASANALYERLSSGLAIDVTPGSPERAELDAAVNQYGLTQGEHDALVALGSSPILRSRWDELAAEHGWAWTIDAAAIRWAQESDG